MTYLSIAGNSAANLAMSAAFLVWTSATSSGTGDKVRYKLNNNYLDIAKTAFAAIASCYVSDRILSGLSTSLPTGVAGTLAKLALRLFAAESVNNFVNVTITRGTNWYGFISSQLNKASS